ncbi:MULTISPECIES: hypothetical protein [Bradyrhizobium]|jgi:hypothetical protein|uniref:Uncharacterized protein n=1 Tax=Bradyrhizobium elkanii TaxID=29448 RepID=A0A8I1Y233_BRAEL|nr:MULTISPECIES: hypothetical protein [Bradyrhizobium]MBP1290955.1 hypothetical protein [Bradyrhizobium elkanii]MCP1928730.1 hypothetical protein [Bradyrhizobium elkanii]MCP1972708.1 hypothetical protein [Bradyrhizobium elkanii]MCS3473948.1 hypothetical protein [Bradyrhizobium elkanii]MCS3519904.1 hypothetical protein [Bradyrhizobium elkanii]
MRILAQVLAVILLLSSGVASFAGEIAKPGRSSPALTNGEGQPKVTKQKNTHRLQGMMDQRDWDHRKAGRDWRMRGDNENLGQ